ncbi:MAG: hypothetical protein IH969_09235, partial [Candidatus Krumholzibacteriota bacterium]|nr:hypothetical protein [Candidatus Krumholzibacteriota bacterium]
MSANDIPQAVLSEQIAGAIAGRRVRTAVFTTYTFDPGFFELNILPTLFDQPFSQVDVIRRVQLEEALRCVREVSVYYDRSALFQTALPAQLDFTRNDVSRGPEKGVFHPKLIMLLVEEPAEDNEDESSDYDPYESLIVGTLSANLTRSGWWENVEAAHFEEIKHKDLADGKSPFRKDLLHVIQRIRETGREDDDHTALDQIEEFVRKSADRQEPSKVSRRGVHFTRLFFGQKQLADWLAELRLDTGCNLEVISPYFDKDHAGTLEKMIDALEPRKIRVYLPRKNDGTALVSEELYDAIAEYASWSNLPSDVLTPGARARSKELMPRRVHAKVYRLWSEDKQVVLVGSVNLTGAGHSHSHAGNLEAAFFVDVTESGLPARWWLKPIDAEPSEYLAEQPGENEGIEPVPIDFSVQYDWARDELSCFLDRKLTGTLRISAASGHEICTVENISAGKWVLLPESAADGVRELLKSTSYLLVEHKSGNWRVLVREVGMSHRPSLLLDLTPEQILTYWSLLTASQKEAFIAERLAAEGKLDLEGIPVGRGNRYVAHDTIFDRFAGIYHAFERLYRHVEECIERGEYREAEARLFGAKYDSMPQLLQKTDEKTKDPIMRYIVFLCGQQIADRVRRKEPQLWRQWKTERKQLEEQLKKLRAIESAVPIVGEDREKFLSWYRRMFLTMVR